MIFKLLAVWCVASIPFSLLLGQAIRIGRRYQ